MGRTLFLATFRSLSLAAARTAHKLSTAAQKLTGLGTTAAAAAAAAPALHYKNIYIYMYTICISVSLAVESVARATYYKYIYIKYYFKHVIYTNQKSKVEKCIWETVLQTQTP